MDEETLTSRLWCVVARLTTYRLRYEAKRDSRAVFAYTYELLAAELAEHLGEAGFTNPEWIVRFDEVFAALYFEALDAYDAKAPVSDGWHVVFDAMSRRRTSVLEEMLIGMASHIVGDLPVALNRTRDPARATEELRDFHRMNDVLGRAIDRIQPEVARRYNPSLAWLDRLAGRQDEILTNYAIRVARGLAWYNAQRLRDASQTEDVQRALHRAVARIVHDLLDPPFWTWRRLLRLLHFCLSLFRRWPTHPYTPPPSTADAE